MGAKDPVAGPSGRHRPWRFRAGAPWTINFLGSGGHIGDMGGMDATIRLATAEDVAVVTALTRAAYARWVTVIGREPLPMQADYAAAIRHHRIDLLTVGAEVAALVETVLRAEDLLIENVAVAPPFQKRGYGRRMLAHAEQLAVQAGLRHVRLYTNARFDANVRLYASLGYEVEREAPLNGGVAIHMRKCVA